MGTRTPPLREAPRLDDEFPTCRGEARRALLLNPFYTKDPHASFPASTSSPQRLHLPVLLGQRRRAGRYSIGTRISSRDTRPGIPSRRWWRSRYNLTFSQRAFQLASGIASVARKCYSVVCTFSHAQTNVGRTPMLWSSVKGLKSGPRSCRTSRPGTLKPQISGLYPPTVTSDPSPAPRSSRSASLFLTTTSVNATRGCHNRCEFCYLSTRRLRIPYQCRDVEQLQPRSSPMASRTVCHRQQPRLRVRITCGNVCLRLRSLKIIWKRSRNRSTFTDDPSLRARNGARPVSPGASFLGFESLTDANPSRIPGRRLHVLPIHARRVQVSTTTAFR